MKITREDLGDRQVVLTIEVDEERVENALRGVARRISRQYNIPGFRRGRAPYHVIVQRLGRETLLHEVLDDIGPEVIAEALEREEIEPYDMGELQDVQFDPLVLKLRMPLRPVVDLGDYRALRLDPPEVTVDEAEIDAELEQLRQANAILEPADRPAQMGDMVRLDVNITLDGESIVDEQDHQMVLKPENDYFEAGFDEQIVGMAVNEEKQFTLTLAEAWGEERAGKEATFNVTLRDVKNRILPDLDDDLARTTGDFDTLEELRQDIRKQFEEKTQREADADYADKALAALIESATIEYPPDAVEDQVDTMMEDLKQRLKPQGLEFSDYLKLTGQTEEDFRETLRPQAETIIQRGLVLGKLASEEGLDVEGDEVDERIAALSASWGERAAEMREALSVPENVRLIFNRLLTDKAVDRLVAIAKGEAPPLEVDEPEIEEAEAGQEEGVESPDEETD